MGTTGSSVKKKTALPPNPTPSPSTEEENEKLKKFRAMNNQDAAKYAHDTYMNRDDQYLVDNGMSTHNMTQALVEELNLHDKPVVLSDADYDSQWKANALNGVEVYRGLGYNPDGSYQNQFLYGDKTFIGDGAHDQGIYMSSTKRYASLYAGGAPAKETVTGFIDKSKAKVITEENLEHLWHSESSTVRMGFMDKSAYALYKGYNVIHVVGGNNGSQYAHGLGSSKNGYGDFYLPLTRRVLVMREHTKVK